MTRYLGIHALALAASRMCAAGASYGGHLANWLEATTTRYKCLVSHAGEVDLTTQWGESDYIYERELVNGGPPLAGQPDLARAEPHHPWRGLEDADAPQHRRTRFPRASRQYARELVHPPAHARAQSIARVARCVALDLEARGQPAFLRRGASLARPVSEGHCMNPFQSDFLRTLHERGFIHQQTDAARLDAAARQGVVTAYVGYDATADSSARGQSRVHHAATPFAAHGSPADRSDGRGHDESGRSFGTGRDTAASSPSRRSRAISRASARSSSIIWSSAPDRMPHSSSTTTSGSESSNTLHSYAT